MENLSIFVAQINVIQFDKKMRLKYFMCLLISSLVIYSCNDDSEINYTIGDYTDAQIYSFSVAATHQKVGDSIPRAQDSIRFLVFNKVKFSIDQVKGQIYNPDSLPYGLKLGKVKLTTTFNSTYGAGKVEVITPDSTYEWNTTDSVDFSKMPIKLRVTSVTALNTGSSETKEYDVKVLIHKIDPDVMSWSDMGSLPHAVGLQKVLLVNNEFYSYSVLSGTLSLYKSSASGLSWSSKALSVIPSNVELNSLTYFDGRFLAVSKTGGAYSSVNGESWTSLTNGKEITQIYGVLPGTTEDKDSLLVLVKNGATYSYGTTKDLSVIVPVSYISGSPGNVAVKTGFPVSGFSSTTNYSRTKSTNMLILVGGVDKNNTELNTTWLIKKSADGVEMGVSSKNPLFAGEGMSLFPYNSKLYVLANSKLYTSDSWGENWEAASVKQALPSSINERSHQSVVTDATNSLWIFGGVSTTITVPTTYFKDIWKGHLNALK